MEKRNSSEYPEFKLIRDELSCSEKEIRDLIRTTRKQYPSVDTDRDAVYLLAKQNNLQFDYNKSGKISGVTELNKDLDVDLALFLD